MNIAYWQSPLGWISIAANQQGLQHILFVEQATDNAEPCSLTDDTISQLQDYFQRRRQHFTLPLAPRGTPFQHKVWQALQQIDYGQTGTYRQIAERINNPKAVRAVGAANGRNPLTIVVPCHRIIGSNGQLTGYAGGLSRKAFLLDLEHS